MTNWLYARTAAAAAAAALERTPRVAPEALSAHSTVRDAVHAFVHNDLSLAAARAAGKTRGHEPYLTLAREHGDTTLADVTRRWAMLYVTRLYNERQLAAGTVNGVVSKWRRLWDWLYALEVVDANPWQGMRRAPATQQRRDARALTPAEIAVVLDCLRRVRARGQPLGIYADVYEVGLETAMRYGEVLRLCPEMLHLDAPIPHVVLPENYAKTRRSREVILSPRATWLLRHHSIDREPGERVFNLGESALQEVLRKIRVATGIPCQFHNTRHTACSRYSENCETLDELQAFTGHASKQSAEVYARAASERARHAVYKKLLQRDAQNGPDR